jgi:uncharacterized protein YoaH (UPF0181 family)
MADLQQIPPSMQRRQLLELIDEQQQKAWRKLQASGVSEAQALAVMPRIRQPRPSAWQTFLANMLKLLIWLCGLPASFLLTTFFIGWDSWALIGPISLFVLWLVVRFSFWGLLFPLTALAGAVMFFVYPYL